MTNDECRMSNGFYLKTKLDGLVKSRRTSFFVIPVKTGSSVFKQAGIAWILAGAGMTIFYESFNLYFAYLAVSVVNTKTETMKNAEHAKGEIGHEG